MCETSYLYLASYVCDTICVSSRVGGFGYVVIQIVGVRIGVFLDSRDATVTPKLSQDI